MDIFLKCLKLACFSRALTWLWLKANLALNLKNQKMENTRHTLYFLIGIVLFGLLLFALATRRRKSRANGHLRSVVMDTIISQKKSGTMPYFHSRFDAVKYVARTLKKIMADHPNQKDYELVGDINIMCNQIVNHLCDFGTIPKSVYKSWV